MDRFGWSVATSGTTAIVGAPGDQIGANSEQGSAYIFIAPSNPLSFWQQQAKLMIGDGGTRDLFGFSVAISSNTVVVGASEKKISDRPIQGAAYHFSRSGAVWSLQQPIIASDGQANDIFGYSVAVSDDTIVAGAFGGGGVDQGAAYVLKNNCGAPLAPIASVSAASYVAGGAPESIIVGFGANLATSAQAASAQPLPTQLSGVSVVVRDGGGAERLAPLFFVSPGQINYQIPPGTANGLSTVTVTSASGPIASGAAQISTVAPGLFTANSSGQGVAAALALRIKADGSQSFEPVAQFDPAQNRFVPVPIDLGPATDQVFLALYGTGLRFRSSLSAVNCAIGGVGSEALFAGAVPGFVGLDQVNVRLSRSLAGRGEVDVVLSVDGKAANTVRVGIR